MARIPPKWLGTLAIGIGGLTAFVATVMPFALWRWWVTALHLTRSPAELLMPVTWVHSALLLLAQALIAWMAFWLWRLATGSGGARLLLSAFVLCVASPALFLAASLLLGIAVSRALPLPSTPAVLIAQLYFPGFLGLVGQVLLVLGLLRSRIVPGWIAWLGVGVMALASIAGVVAAWQTLMAVAASSISLAQPGAAPSEGLARLSSVLSALFWVALGGAFLFQSRTRETSRQT